nr:MAG TPA: hypothetical protein [Caudoviricetes sp.]
MNSNRKNHSICPIIAILFIQIKYSSIIKVQITLRYNLINSIIRFLFF